MIDPKGAVLRGLKQAFARHRIELAAKTALAAGLAWALAPLIPGPAAQYPYYAPLGALITMHPTVADSARNGFQSLLGLGLGIGAAFAVAANADANSLTIALVVGIGVLIGGLPKMGAARDWAPVAALFVLVIGGHRADEFSAAYIVQMALGVGIGFAVNWIIMPPLHFEAVGAAFARHRHALGDQLEDMATAMTESWPPDHEEWAEREGVLTATASEVRQAVGQAELSARANPRRERRSRDLRRDLDDVRAIERVTFQIQDITEVLASAIWEESSGTSVPHEVTDLIAEALNATAAMIRGWTDDGDVPDLADQAQAAVDGLNSGILSAASGEASVSAASSVAMSLRRVISTVRARAGSTA